MELKLQELKMLKMTLSLRENYSNVTWVEYVRLVKQQVYINNLLITQKLPKPEPPDPLSNYLGWLIQAFAGNINGTV
jgi:hypothetical protein